MNQIKLHKKTYTRRKIENNILRYYQSESNWYFNAYSFAEQTANKHNYKTCQIVGLIACFSPQVSWEQNKGNVIKFIKDGINCSIFASTKQKLQAKNILKCQDVKGIIRILNNGSNDKARKIVSFFNNILFYDLASTVTIDRHAIAIGIQRPEKTSALKQTNITKGQYTFFESCYINVAIKLNILPHVLQAETWVNYRIIRGIK